MLLNNHSWFSLRYGTLSPDNLVNSLKQAGWSKVVLTDINNSAAMPDFVKACRKAGLTPVGGMELRRDGRLLYIALAQNNEGMTAINRFLTEHNLSRTPLPDRAPPLPGVFFIYDFSFLPKAASLRPDEWVGIRAGERFRLPGVPARIRQKLVALHPVTFADDDGYELHRHLRAIDNNILLSMLQPGHLARKDEKPLSPQALRKRFSGFDFLLDHSRQLLENASLDYDFTTVKNKKHYSQSSQDDIDLLRKLAYEGMKYRYGDNNSEAKARVDKELDIIRRLGFASYFLITHDIIQYSLSKGYHHTGRGSGANSVVAYCLKIVDVDPIELNLYFERFINPKRTSPPDFDIDYSWKERDDVLDYIFKRFGRGHVALLGAMSTFAGKSIYRELGKVYGLPKEEIDDLIRFPAEDRNKNAITTGIHRIAAMMAGMPNLRTIHAGGVLVSEEPLARYTALDLPPKGFPTTQWDMYVAEDLGYEKIDILSQRGIGHIRDAVKYIRQNRGIHIDIHRVEKFKTDQKVKALLRSGETTGCFYIESPAMRGLLKKLRCDNYLTLVAASSVIRPGVARSGMMREFITRYNNPHSFKYLHPVMKEQLEETYGVMVYQEDVLRVCHHYAGLDLGDADVLRRAMSGKTRSKDEFNRIVNKFFSNSRKLGRPDNVTKEVWRQIESFAGYSFSKAHSASYAVESFQSLFLKASFPLEFITAVINNFGGFYRSWLYFNEARRLGGKIMLPDVNQSEYLTRVEQDRIHIGFVHLQSLETKMAKAIVAERQRNGNYRSLENFVQRINPGIEQLLLLIRSGAFAFTGKTKAALMWEAYTLTGKKNNIPRKTPSLFPDEQRQFRLPALKEDPIANAWDEIEIIGFPVSLSWFDLLKTKFRGEIMAKQMLQNTGKTLRMAGLLVTIKYVKTIKNDYMYFGTFLDAEGHFFDTVHFPAQAKKYPFRGDGIYLLKGTVTEEFGQASLEIQQMAKLPLKENPVN